MDYRKRIEELENLKQNYLALREFVLYYKNALIYNQELANSELNKKQKDIKVKKLVLTKPFYGKDLVVG